MKELKYNNFSKIVLIRKLIESSVKIQSLRQENELLRMIADKVAEQQLLSGRRV
jgi:hypothetical protein